MCVVFQCMPESTWPTCSEHSVTSSLVWTMAQSLAALWSGPQPSSLSHSSAGSDQPTKHSDLTQASTSWSSFLSSLVSSASLV